MRKGWLLTGLLACLGIAHAVAGTTAPVRNLLDPALAATLPRQSVQMSVHDHVLHCEGVSLAALLRAGGAMPDKPLRGADLARVVRIHSRDGYRVTFSLGELDDTLGARQVVLADRCEGAALDDKDGPWRLLVPADGRPARSARQVERIEVGD